MAFLEPQVMTIAGTAYTLNRVSNLGTGSIYTDPTEKVKMTIQHARAKRKRSVFRIDFEKTAPDPLVGSMNAVYSTSVALTVDRPLIGFSVAELETVVVALRTYLGLPDATTQFLQGES